MAVNYTPLIDGQDADAAQLNSPLQELDDAIEDIKDGTAAFTVLKINGDPGSGTAGTTIITDVTDTPTTDPGWTTSSTVNMNAPDGYIKLYVGTQAVVVPYWNT